MRRAALVLLVAALVAAGCITDSKRITLSYVVQPDSIAVLSTTAPVGKCDVDLNAVSTYRSTKSEVRGVSEAAFLGSMRNTGLTFVGVEWWMTPDVTSYTTAADVRANGTLLWKAHVLEPGRVYAIDWNDSASHASRGIETVLLREIQGDGVFSLYVLGAGTTTSYSFAVLHSALLMVLETGS